jgi:hypothetical protein
VNKTRHSLQVRTSFSLGISLLFHALNKLRIYLDVLDHMFNERFEVTAFFDVGTV